MSGSKSSAISTNSNSNSYPQPANRRGIPFRCTYIYHHRTTIIKLVVSTSFYNAKLCREVLFFFLQLLFFNYTTLNYFCFLLIFEKKCKIICSKVSFKRITSVGDRLLDAREIWKCSFVGRETKVTISRSRDVLLFQTWLFCSTIPFQTSPRCYRYFRDTMENIPSKFLCLVERRRGPTHRWLYLLTHGDCSLIFGH